MKQEISTRKHTVDSAAAIFMHDHITRADWDKVVQEDVILHQEFYYQQKPKVEECDLFRAVLEQAFVDFLTLLPKRNTLKHKFNEVYNYFFNERTNIEIGSFNFICDTLDLNQNYIRKQLTYEENRFHQKIIAHESD